MRLNWHLAFTNIVAREAHEAEGYTEENLGTVKLTNRAVQPRQTPVSWAMFKAIERYSIGYRLSAALA
jgi:hypothetical protein